MRVHRSAAAVLPFLALLAIANMLTAAVTLNAEPGSPLAGGGEATNPGSLSIEGEWMMVGASGQVLGQPGAVAGSVRVYRRVGGAWSQFSVLTGSNEVSDGFGTAVAIRGDLAAIGQPEVGVAGTRYGRVYIFRWNGTAWANEAIIRGDVEAGRGGLGRAIAWHGDQLIVQGNRLMKAYQRIAGSWLMVSSRRDAFNGSSYFGVASDGQRIAALSVAKIQVLRLGIDGGFVTENVLDLPDRAGISNGTAIAMAGDRVIAARGQGTADVFVRSASGAWSLAQTITGGGSGGMSVAANGDLLALAQPGTLRVFAWDGTAYVAAATSTAGTAIGVGCAFDGSLLASNGTASTSVFRVAAETGAGAASLSIRRNDAALASAPAGGDFGTVPVNTTRRLTFQLVNPGASAIDLESNPVVAISGANADDFQVLVQPGRDLIEGGGVDSCTIAFSPSGSGTRQATLLIVAGGQVWSAALTGTGGANGAPQLVVDSPTALMPYNPADIQPSYLSYSGQDGFFVANATRTTVRTFVLSNPGGAALTVSNISLEDVPGAPATSADPAWWSVSAPATPFAILPGGSVPITVTLDPTAPITELQFRRLRIDNDGTGVFPSPYLSQLVGWSITGGNADDYLTILGNGLEIYPLDITPRVADGTDAGPVPVGASVTRTFRITNNSLVSVFGIPDYISVTGLDPADFSISPAGAVVIESKHYGVPYVEFTVTFRPQRPGLRQARFTYGSGFFALQCTGTLSATPKPRLEVQGRGAVVLDGSTSATQANGTDLGTVTLGGSASQAFALANLGDAVLNLTGNPLVTISGSSAFSILRGPSSTAIQAGRSDGCTVVYQPVAIGTHSATVTIASDDPNPGASVYTFQVQGQAVAAAAAVVRFAQDAVTADGTASSVPLLIVRDGNTATAFSASWQTSPGTAQNGVDFTASSGTVSFAAGEIAKQISIPILASAVGGRSFTVAITGSGGQTLGAPSTATVTIDKPSTASLLSITAERFSIAEGASGGTAVAYITVSRSGGTSGAVSVAYATSDGTATSADYAASSGTLNWSAGDTADKSFAVSISGDALAEGTETINLTLSAPAGGAVLGRATAILDILDDDGSASGPGDLNGDRVVNIGDLTLVTGHFGQTSTSPGWSALADANGDGVVNISDLTLVSSNFGRTYP